MHHLITLIKFVSLDYLLLPSKTPKPMWIFGSYKVIIEKITKKSLNLVFFV